MQIVAIANKWWECEAMLNTNAFPPPLSDGSIVAPWCDSLASPRTQITNGYNTTTRATFFYKQGKNVMFTVEVWCVCLRRRIFPAAAVATHIKEKLFKPGEALPDLVIAVGTAGTANESPNRSGGVAVGAQVFRHNAHPPNTPEANPKSNWSDSRLNRQALLRIDCSVRRL
jgi:hypothetical protein